MYTINMDITFVLAVYNKIDLTKECYRRLRLIYPDTPLTICSGGSTDETEEWLKSLNDFNLKFIHSEKRISFSETYNLAISLVETDKLVLIHNDMVIGKGFIESLNRLLTEDMVLSYTTIEPPIFEGHKRPGKVILDLGSNFETFNDYHFNNYVEQWKNNDTIYDGAVFFMSGYKKMFDDVGGFDGKTFFPCFCEDDDFLIRAKLKGYKLKTCDSAITYHFVSQTSRFSEDFKNKRISYEMFSIKNFIRKWGMPIYSFNKTEYWNQTYFKYKKYKIGLICNSPNIIEHFEPFFDKIECVIIPINYINNEQKYTIFDISNKFNSVKDMDVIVTSNGIMTNDDFNVISQLQLIIPEYGIGKYEIGNMVIDIKVSN